MTLHPYIGRVFKARRYPYTGPDAGKYDIRDAVCVWVGQAGSTASEDSTAFGAAVVRAPDGEHHEVPLVQLVGPLDDPNPPVPTGDADEVPNAR